MSPRETTEAFVVATVPLLVGNCCLANSARLSLFVCPFLLDERASWLCYIIAKLEKLLIHEDTKARTDNPPGPTRTHLLRKKFCRERSWREIPLPLSPAFSSWKRSSDLLGICIAYYVGTCTFPSSFQTLSVRREAAVRGEMITCLRFTS